MPDLRSRIAAGRIDTTRIDAKAYDRTPLGRLQDKVDAQASLIRAQAAMLAESRRTFERASTEAGLGLWECRLRDEALNWSGGVYDLFEIPRGSSLQRERTLEHYPAASLSVLEAVRSRAIATGTGFRLETEIVTAKGRRRWMRLTATVDCERGSAVRIFGMKQDITEEKIAAERLRTRAEFDAITGLANRFQFQDRLAGLDGCGTLMLVDLDGFKQVNDGFGHAAGDACLGEAARRLTGVCQGADLVARIGGDEFAVLLGPRLDSTHAESMAQRVIQALAEPMRSGGATFRIGASLGIASVAGHPPAIAFANADAALYAAKAAGRNTFRTHGTAPDRARTGTGL